MIKLRQSILFGILCAATAIFNVSCDTPGQGTATGALVGGGTGALVGNLIGRQSGHATEGTLIGAGVGAAAGGVMGHQQGQINQMQRDMYYRGY